MPDSPMKRQGERAVARSRREHISISAMLEGLEKPMEKPEEMEKDGILILKNIF